jgi:hypothetical protein
MKKIYLFLGLSVVFGLSMQAQTITPDYINFTQLANYEAAHPEMFAKCPTCGRKENEAEKHGIADLPTPPGAIIKRAPQDNLRPNTPSNPFVLNTPNTPLGVSPAPTQNFLGHVDPGDGIPPDTHGAIGPNHIITATNDFLIVQTKSGAQISRVGISTFTGIPTTCDPYVKYDEQTNRWFYIAIGCDGNNGNRMAVAVTNSSDPTGGWFVYRFVAGTNYFLDHPYLGFDERWVVVSGRKFPAGGSFDGPLLLLIDKANIVANNPITFGTNAQKIEKTNADGDAPLPVTVYGPNPNPGTFYILQNWNGTNSQIRLSTVTGNIPNATWNTTGTGAVFPTGGASWISATGNVAEQVGETRRLATNDARISTGVMVNGSIWCAHHIGISTTNVAVQWWQLNGTGAGTPSFGNVLQRGRIGAGLPNNYRYFPAIAVNQLEDVIIGYTVSSNTSRVSAAYSYRGNTTPLNTTDDEFIYKVGLSTYYKDFGGTRARWGDYSHSALDPADGSLWTIQEYADQRTNATDNGSRYGVWWAQITPVSSLLNTDALIGAIVEPAPGLLCVNPVSPKVTIRNLGLDTIKSVQVGMILDGVALPGLTSLTGLAVPTFGSSAALTITPTFSVGPGTHTLRVYTTNPNGVTDQRLRNDTASVTFTLAPTLALPYAESFESATFPPNNGAAIINPDGGITWARFTTAGNPGNASMRLNFYDYQTVGQRDIFRTAKINVDVLDSVLVQFNVAHQQYFGTDVPFPSNDSLKIVYSPDCGLTWFPTSYAKGGANLATVATPSGNSFVPTASQWRTERVILKDFCNKNLKTVMIGFEAYNDFGNNLYVDGVNISEFRSAARNSAVKSISQPLPALCSNAVSPVVTIRNEGLDTIKTLKVNYQIDGGAVSTLNWTGALAKCDAVTLTLGTTNSTVGSHTLKVFTSDLNASNDQVTNNDTLTKIFSIYEVASTPISEGFEGLGNGLIAFPRANWGVQNVTGGTTWQLDSTRNASRTGNRSIVLNNPNAANSNGALDYFISPIVQNSASFDSVFVDFDLAYRPGVQYPGATVFPLDTLEILATFDCGATFTSVWKKFGNELQTVNDPSYTYTSAFVPQLKTEWKNIRVYLTPYVNASNFQLYIAAKGNKQNNMWLDNINITSKTLPQKLKDQGYLIYPNPFNGSFLIHHSAVEPPTDLQSAQVFNAAGQLVWDRRYNGNADRQITVNLKDMARGMYILKLMYTNKTVVERIIKN